jgi:hypothetical protein
MKRKYLHIILAVVLILSLLPVRSVPKNSVVYAEQKSAEEICEILGVLKGEGEGLTEEYLSKKTERLQAVIMTLRLAGNNYEEIAMEYEGSDNFADADEILWNEGRNIMAYIKDNPQFGWRGSTDGKFIPRDIVTAQMFYKVLLEALGYKQDYGEGGDFAWEEVMDFAFFVGLWDLVGVEELTNRHMAVGIVEALQLMVKDSDKTLLEKLIEDGSIEMEKAIAAGLMAQEPDEPEEPEIVSLKEIDLASEIRMISFPAVSRKSSGVKVELSISLFKFNMIISLSTTAALTTLGGLSTLLKGAATPTASISFPALSLIADICKTSIIFKLYP